MPPTKTTIQAVGNSKHTANNVTMGNSAKYGGKVKKNIGNTLTKTIS